MAGRGPDDELDPDQQRVLRVLLGMQRESWEQGVTGHALLDLGRGELVRVLARDAVTRQTSSGMLAEFGDAALVNCAANAEVVRWAARSGGAPLFVEALDRQLRWLQETCPRAGDGTLFHLSATREVWVDTVYMVVPVLVAVGDLEGAAAQLAGHRRRLCDPTTHLYGARWDEDRGELTHPSPWGTGNGWVAAGIARALHHLRGADISADASQAGSAAEFRRIAAGHAREVIDACLAARQPDGVFCDMLDDPTSFSEANLAQMLAYAVFTGVTDGWLPAPYATVGRSLLAAARERIDADGFVTGVCGAPYFDRSGTSAEAQAFFLLASAAEQHLTARSQPAQAG